MDGMHAGYNARVDQQQQPASQQPGGGAGSPWQLGPGAGGAPSLPHLSMVDFLWMSAVGDLGDLQEALCGSDAQAAGAAGGLAWLLNLLSHQGGGIWLRISVAEICTVYSIASRSSALRRHLVAVAITRPSVGLPHPLQPSGSG